ncbi:MAG: hypothetical protein O3C67_06895 [Cyanobacteria bacterium]|nr:hypothetical protein [Cyanobacteriota bacterium]
MANRASSLPLSGRRAVLTYGVTVVILTATLAGLKGLAAWAMDTYVYTLPLFGGLLESLELVEVSNVLLFALLGVGLGAATRNLAGPLRGWRRVGLLLLTVPIVFLSSYWVRQYLWIQKVAIASEISPTQAAQVTDRLLQEATGHEGLLGFFVYTVRAPLLPTDLGALKSLDEDDQWFRSELTRQSGVEPGLFTLIFQVAGWGIRLFYMALAAITATIYFARGSLWAEARRAPAPNPPGRPGVKGQPPARRRAPTSQPPGAARPRRNHPVDPPRSQP